MEGQIDKYVKLESNKKATISTIGKLIKFTKEKDACYLCKQQVSKDCVKSIEKNFNPDVTSFDAKIKIERDKLNIKLKDFEKGCCKAKWQEYSKTNQGRGVSLVVDLDETVSQIDKILFLSTQIELLRINV